MLVWMPYTLLVEFSMLLSVPSILLFMWSFVALRIQRPFVDRPFLIPGGLPVAVLLTVIPVAISISYAAIIATESTFAVDADASTSEQRSRSSDGGLPPIYQVYSMFAVILCGGLVHCAFVLAAKHGYACGAAAADDATGMHAVAGVDGAADMPPLAHELSAEVAEFLANGGGDDDELEGLNGEHQTLSGALRSNGSGGGSPPHGRGGCAGCASAAAAAASVARQASGGLSAVVSSIGGSSSKSKGRYSAIGSFPD
jgi:hypothetical protein